VSTLGVLLDSIDELDPDLTIYAPATRPLSAEARAIVAQEPDDGALPPAAEGLVYLLEVPTAKEVIQVWTDWRTGRRPTTADRVTAVVHYADNDSYLPLDED
jgi:hypothetical protein